MQDRVDGLNIAVGNFWGLEANKHVYSLNLGATQNEVSFVPFMGKIVISYSGTALFIHETTYAGQFETRDIAFDRANGATFALDAYDEVVGYKVQ